VVAATVPNNDPVPAVDKPVSKDADVIVKTIPKTKVISKYFSKTYLIHLTYNTSIIIDINKTEALKQV
jgi:hypothetical protein